MGYYTTVKKNEGNHTLTNKKNPPNHTVNENNCRTCTFCCHLRKAMKFYTGLSTKKKIFWNCTVQYSSCQPRMTTDP